MRYLVETDSETVDLICLKQYGQTATYTEMVLAANPKLAVLGAFVPIGTVLVLPEVKKTVVKAQKNLWD